MNFISSFCRGMKNSQKTNFASFCMKNYKTFHTFFILSEGLFPACTPGKVFFVGNEMRCLRLLCSVMERLAPFNSLNVLQCWSRDQKNEQRSNVLSSKKQCSCWLSGSSENRAFEGCRSTVRLSCMINKIRDIIF